MASTTAAGQRRVQLQADLTFEVETRRTSDGAPAVLRGSVRAQGSHVVVRSDVLLAVAGQPSRRQVRAVAAQVAHQGFTVDLYGPNGLIVSAGQVGFAPLSRLITGSRHLRIRSLRQALATVRSRRRSAPDAACIEAPVAPPATLWPPAPTLRGLPRPGTTTHDPGHGGRPRLYIADSRLANPRPGVVALGESTTIGSSIDCDLVLDGLDAVQAEIVHTTEDEFELVVRSASVPVTVGGLQAPRQLLRTGSRLQIGPWRMSFVRDEYADHGRPFGGRVGGEFGRQRTQPVPPERTGPSF